MFRRAFGKATCIGGLNRPGTLIFGMDTAAVKFGAATKQVDAATLARLIYTSRHEALAVTGGRAYA